MKRAFTVATAVGVVAIAGAAIFAVAGGKVSFCSMGSGSADSNATQTAHTQSSGKVLGKFDLAMAGCRFACATKLEYDASAVIAQPGAEPGKLTQCPVSGVVFSVDASRPHVAVGADDYVTCCDACAEKLRNNPRRFVRV